MKAAIYKMSGWLNLTDPQKLKPYFEKLLLESKFIILSCGEHYFQPHGWTCFWVLAESHFAIHTFPENNATYIELSSCSKEDFDIFLQNLQLSIEKLTISSSVY